MQKNLSQQKHIIYKYEGNVALNITKSLDLDNSDASTKKPQLRIIKQNNLITNSITQFLNTTKTIIAVNLNKKINTLVELYYKRYLQQPWTYENAPTSLKKFLNLLTYYGIGFFITYIVGIVIAIFLLL